MSHLEDLAKSMGISSDELFSGKYGDSYDEILDNLMMKKLNGESKANENKTYTCAKCGQVGFDFSDMAKEECPNDLGNGHEIPIFGDMKTGEAYDFTENDIEKARSGWDGADEYTRKKVIQVMYAGSKPPFDDLHTFNFDRLPDYIQQEFTRNHAYESYYGYGSTTGRMSPAEHWKQGLDAYGDMGYDSKLHSPMYDEFRGMNFSELPDDIKSSYLNKHGYRDTTVSGESVVNSDRNEFGQLIGESFEDRDWKFRVIDWFNAMSDDKKFANGLPEKHWDDLGGSEHDMVYAKAKQFGVESIAKEMGDVLIDDTPYGFMEPDNPNSPMGDWTTIYGTSYTDGRQTIVDVPDDEEKAFTDILEQEGYDWIPEKGYYGFKEFEKEVKANEDSLIKIEDDDDKDTKVTVLDEWKNEKDPDVGGDVKGLDQAEVKESELKDRYKCNVCDNKFDELFYSQYEDQGMCPFCGSTYIDEFNVETFVDYSEIGESKTARTKYECEFCNSGFKSNESLSIHYNDIHAVPPTPVEGYENWKDVANDLYKKELGKKSKKLRGEGYYELDNEEDVENARRGMKMNVDQLNKSEKDDGTDMNFHQGFDWQEGGEAFCPHCNKDIDITSEIGWNDHMSAEHPQVQETYTDDEIEAHKKTGGSYPASWLEASNKMEAQAHPDPDSFPYDSLSQESFGNAQQKWNEMGWVRRNNVLQKLGLTNISPDTDFLALSNDVVDKISAELIDYEGEGFQQGLYGYVDAKCKTCGVEFDSVPDMDDHYKNNPDHESNIGDLDSTIPNTESFKEECFNVDGQQIDCDTGEVIGDGFSKSDAYNKFLYESGGYNPEGDTEEAGSRMREEKEWYDDHSDELDEEQAKGGFDWQFNGETYADESVKDKWDGGSREEREFLLEGIKLTEYEYEDEINKSYDDLDDSVKKFINFPSVESYASEDDYQYDFDELTSLAQDKLDDEGVSQDEWDESSEEEKKDIEEQVKEAYNPEESICPECGDKTTNDKEFDDHLASHRFDTGDY